MRIETLPLVSVKPAGLFMLAVDVSTQCPMYLAN